MDFAGDMLVTGKVLCIGLIGYLDLCCSDLKNSYVVNILASTELLDAILYLFEQECSDPKTDYKT